jgi:hypothetical protein
MTTSGPHGRRPTAITILKLGLAGWVGLSAVALAYWQEGAAPPAPKELAHYFPRKDLVVYAEFGGLDAHRDSWTKTAAYRLWNETSTGALYEQAIARAAEALAATQAKSPVTGQEVAAAATHLLRSGFAVGINRAGGEGPPRCLGIVMRGGAHGPVRALFDKILKATAAPDNKEKTVKGPRGRTIHTIATGPDQVLAWWTESDDLVVSLVSPVGPESIMAALDGDEPSAVDHPARTALAKSKDAPGFQPVGLAFFAMAALPALPKEAVALGLDRIERFDYRFGFNGPALESIVGVVAPKPRQGIPALFDQPDFELRQLPAVPGGLAQLTVLSIDPARAWDMAVGAMKSADPTAPKQIAALEKQLRDTLGLDLRQDLLAQLGPKITGYALPTKRNAPTNIIDGLAQGYLIVPKAAVLIDVKNRDAVARALNTLAERANEAIESLARERGGAGHAAIHRLKGPEVGFTLSLGSLGLALPAGMQVTFLLGKHSLVVASSPSVARRALDVAENQPPGGPPAGDPLARALESLPNGLTFLTVEDTAQSLLPEVLASLPGLVDSVLASQRLGGGLFTPPGMGAPFISQLFEDVDDTMEVAPPEAPLPKPTAKSKMAAKKAGATAPPPLDPELVPDPDELRKFLFPSVQVLVVDDHGVRFIVRDAFPSVSPVSAVPVAVALLLPAVQAARTAARRAQSTGDLKQIGLALHNFNAANGHFPADIRSKDGKPLLSWRVQILPFIEQQALFNEFHLDEPWDSPHNRELAARMPPPFAHPMSNDAPDMTFYRGFMGKQAIFDPKVPEGVGLPSITDGTSNTLAVVEAKEAVSWTKPESDVPFDPDAKLDEIPALLEKLGGHFPGGFNALFCDASVRFIRESVNPVVFKALITRDAGEVVAADSF